MAASAATNAPVAGLTRHMALSRELNASTSSTNWAGYYAAGGTYNQVSSSWIQPAVDCAVNPTSHSSFWGGLDGVTDDQVEQEGATSDCDNGTASYFAWYETFPQPEQIIDDPVAPGDSMTAVTEYIGGSEFLFTVTDHTQNWTYSTVQSVPNAPRSSAEVIAEDPGDPSGGVWPLADFGTVQFNDAIVNSVPIGDSDPTQIDMAAGGVAKATTSALTDDGLDFAVTWQHS
jgi:hypothetical protein